MRRGFTEFIQIGDREVSLYIQEAQDVNSYKAFIYYGSLSAVAYIKKEHYGWDITIEDFPRWVTDIMPPVIGLIEHRFNISNSRAQSD
jgi:hypothetical protein